MKTSVENSNIKWAFFGSSHFSVLVLDELAAQGLVPQLIVTTPDKPKGRGLKISANEAREWADAHGIEVIAPASLKKTAEGELGAANDLKNHGEKINGKNGWDVFLIASYGKIVPSEILNIPTRKTLNIHPSLLPKFRGPTPLESAILHGDARDAGVTIMQVDEQVDHGPIVASKTVAVSDTPVASDWPPYYHDLETTLAREGARLFAEVLPGWVVSNENDGPMKAAEQDHTAATFTQKISKDDLLIDLVDDPEETLRKIRAYSGGRGAYFILKQKTKDGSDKETRVIVTRAKIEAGQNGTKKLVLERVKPEGRNEMSFDDFKRGIRE